MKFIRWLRNHSRWVLNNKGQFDPGTAILLSGLISGGAGLLGGFLGRGNDEDEDWFRTYMPQVEFLEPPAAQWRGAPTPEQYAEFPEAEKARQTWFGKLQEWGGMPGYGAIAPDWGDIWEQAQKRVKEYYWGGPGGQPGLASKVKASAARRGVSQSPALETELSRMGMQEAGQLKDITTEMATKQAEFGEAGRLNWLQSLAGLTGVRPQYYQPAGMWQQPYANVEQAYTRGGEVQPGTGELIGELGSAVGGAGMQYAQMKWLQDLLKGAGGGGLMGPGGGSAFMNMPNQWDINKDLMSMPMMGGYIAS